MTKKVLHSEPWSTAQGCRRALLCNANTVSAGRTDARHGDSSLHERKTDATRTQDTRRKMDARRECSRVVADNRGKEPEGTWRNPHPEDC